MVANCFRLMPSLVPVKPRIILVSTLHIGTSRTRSHNDVPRWLAGQLRCVVPDSSLGRDKSTAQRQDVPRKHRELSKARSLVCSLNSPSSVFGLTAKRLYRDFTRLSSVLFSPRLLAEVLIGSSALKGSGRRGLLRYPLAHRASSQPFYRLLVPRVEQEQGADAV